MLLVAAGAAVRWWAGDDPSLTPHGAEVALGDYLALVEREDYPAAAELLALGGEPLDERPDLRPLVVDELSEQAIATALAEYCRDGCLAATSIAEPDPDGDGYVVVVSFGEPRGHPLERSFVVGETEDGEPYVRGLPPAGTGSLYTPR